MLQELCAEEGLLIKCRSLGGLWTTAGMAGGCSNKGLCLSGDKMTGALGAGGQVMHGNLSFIRYSNEHNSIFVTCISVF